MQAAAAAARVGRSVLRGRRIVAPAQWSAWLERLNLTVI